MQHGQIILTLLFVPGGDPSKLLQPINRPLYPIAQSIQHFIERAGAPFIPFPWNGVTDPPPLKIKSESCGCCTLFHHKPAWVVPADGHHPVFSPHRRSSTGRTRWPHAAAPVSELKTPAYPYLPLAHGLSFQNLLGTDLAPAVEIAIKHASELGKKFGSAKLSRWCKYSGMCK